VEKIRMMNTKTFAIASVLAASLATAAHAQTLTVTKTNTGGDFVFNVSVSPSAPTNQITFDFNGGVSYVSDSGSPFGDPQVQSTTTNDSYFLLFGGSGPVTFGSETFTFRPTANSTATTYNVVASGPNYAQTAFGTLSAAPEPGSLPVLLLGIAGLAGLALSGAAKRRRATFPAL